MSFNFLSTTKGEQSLEGVDAVVHGNIPYRTYWYKLVLCTLWYCMVLMKHAKNGYHDIDDTKKQSEGVRDRDSPTH